MNDLSDPFSDLVERANDPGTQDDPFADLMEQAGNPKLKPGSSKTGAFARGVARGTLPAIGSLPAIGAGAEAGAALGAFGGPAAPVTVPIGGFIGGVAGAFGGGYAVSKAQDWALSKLPDSWREAIGMDDRQQKLDETQHPVASFMGGVAPYVMTMRPGPLTKAAVLPENATAMQRIMAHPATARVFGGAAMGGIELGQEAVNGDIDWRKAAISTGFGVVFNKPTRIGESLTEMGARPARTLLGRPAPGAVPDMTPAAEPAQDVVSAAPAASAAEAAPPPVPPVTAADFRKEITERTRTGQPYELGPTVAQAGDMKIMGPGITEEVFLGGHEQDPEAAAAAQELRRTEQSLTEPPAAPDIHTVARRMHADLFDRYEAMKAAGEATHELEPEVQAAYRRAAEVTGVETVPHKPAPMPPTGEPIVDSVLHHPDVADAIENVKVNRSQDVPYTAGPDKTGNGLNVDKHFPESFTIDGKTFDPAQPFAVHEFSERHAIDKLMAGGMDEATAYKVAHWEVAEKAEGAWYEAHGIDQAKAEAAYQPFIDKIEHEKLAKGDGDVPKDLFKKPYPHDNVNAAAKESAPVPKPTAEEIARAHEILAKGAEVPASAATAEAAEPSPMVSPPKSRTIEQQRDFIRNDVARQMVKAGRPPEEAQAAGALIAARYETRAAMFKGARGTAEDLYREEGAEILGQGMRSKQGPLPPRASAPRKVDEEKLSLLQFLAHRGGLKPTADLQHTLDKNPFLPGFGKLFRDTGMTEDRAREAASEAGYLAENVERTGSQASLKDLHSAIADEARGRKRYRQGYEPEAKIDLDESEALREAEEPPEGLEPEERELLQSARGKINLLEGRRPIITLMKEANASTFIHETGHDFLEQLLKDSQHEAAPDQLKTDAATTLNWLGVKAPEDIKTRQHEKFARGFEQYMREGTAPSQALASVFAKFKNWLMKIYQTIKDLGSPINEDIRQVFDRMLAQEPQRTVIAPEREPAKSIADLHATDAAEIEPHEVDPAKVRVDQEWTRGYDELPNDIRAELDAAQAAFLDKNEPGPPEDAGGTPGGDQGGPGNVQPVGGRPEPEPASVGGGAESGAERSGVAQAGGEGAGISPAGPGPGSRAQSESVPLAPTPARTLEGSPSRLTDKAGNIRIENLTTREDVATAIRDSAAENNNFIGDRRGVVTDGQVMDLAEALGMDFNQLNTRKIGQAFNAEQVVAARKLLIESATKVSELMKQATIEPTDENLLAYGEARDRHQMIQAQVAGITAEAGRALRAFRSLAGEENVKAIDEFIKGATGRTLFQLRMEAKMGAALDTPAKVSKYLADAQKRTFGRMILEYWINGLISGPATHVTYMVGNAILGLEKAGPETAAAALIGNLRRAMGRQGETVRLGEVGAQFRGAARGLPGAVEASMEAFRTGQTTLLPGETARPLLPFSGDTSLAVARNTTNAPVSWADVGSQMFGLVRGGRDALIAGAKLIEAGGEPGAPALGFSYSPLGQIPDIAVRGVPVLPVGSAIRMPGRFIAAIHSFFRAMNYSMEKSGLAYRTASEEGLTGTAFDARVGDIWQNPTEAVMEKARFQATELTLMGQGSQFVKALSKLTNTPILGFPFLKFVDPFVHIAGNIIDQSIIQRTPVGLLAPEIRADIMGKNGTVAQDMAMARMLVGTALGVTFGGLAAQGLASGSGPSDPRKSAMWRLAGNQAHSVRIGDLWYDVHRLGPMGMLMGIAADMYEVAHLAAKGDLLAAAAHLQHALVQNVFDEGFARGPAELIQAIEDPGRYGEAYLRNMVSSFVPFSVGMAQLARASDPYSRQARTVMDAIRNKIPGVSESLMPRRDIWGNEMQNPEALGMRGLSAIWEKQVSNDPVNRAMLDLGIAPAAVERKIRNVDLTDQQYDDFARMAGRMTKDRLDAIVRSPDFDRWPNHIKVSVITETIRANREAARGWMMARYPQIPRDAYENRVKKLTGEPQAIE